jgi:hypothetical protein
MLFTYRRVGRIPVLPVLAAAGALVVLGGLAALIAVTALAVAGVVAFGIRLLRAVGLLGVRSDRRPAVRGGDIIEGVVVNRSPAGAMPAADETGVGTIARRSR